MDLQARWLTGCLLGQVAANALLEDEVEASVLFHFEFPADSPSILHFHPRSCFSYRGLACQGPGKRPSEEHLAQVEWLWWLISVVSRFISDKWIA